MLAGRKEIRNTCWFLLTTSWYYLFAALFSALYCSEATFIRDLFTLFFTLSTKNYNFIYYSLFLV